MRTQLPSALLATALACTYFAVPAQAQAPRTFVSAAGNDSNPCSFAAPCRHFQAAVNATSAGGEVDALDPAGYGPITITQAITINGQGWSYIAPPANGAAITIPAFSGNVNIRGVSLNGVGVANATGILFNSGDNLNVRDSVISNFPVAGIMFEPFGVGGALFVSNTLVSDSGYGIRLLPFSTSAVATASISRSQLQNNGTGFSLDATDTSSTAPFAVNATITDTVVTNNSNIGVAAIGGATTTAYVSISNSPITYNGVGAYAGPTGNASIEIDRTTIKGNTTSLFICGSCVISGDNTNWIDFNGTNTLPNQTGTLH
jgi:hypothetical protein